MQVEVRALTNFTALVIPVLLFTTVVFLVSLFYGVLVEPPIVLTSEGFLAIFMLSLVGAMIGDLLLLDATKVAMKKLQTC